MLPKSGQKKAEYLVVAGSTVIETVLEHEGYSGALTDARLTKNNITNVDRIEDGLLEEILSTDNLNKV